MVGVKVADETGSVRATWFNQPWVSVEAGKRRDDPDHREAQPERPGGAGVGDGRRRPTKPTRVAEERSGSFVPVHPATEDLPPKKIREWAEQAVPLARNAIEGLPARGPGEAPLRLGRRGDQGGALPVLAGGARGGAPAARLRRALPPPGAADDAQSEPPARPPGAALRPSRRRGRALARRPALRPDRRPARRLRRHRRRRRLGRADAAPADGGGRLGQDRGRRLRDAAGARSRPPGGADGADRDARRAARDHARAPARRRGGALRRC